MTRREILVAQGRKRLPVIVLALTVAVGTVILTSTVFAATPPTQGSVVSTAAQTCEALTGCAYTSVTANTPYSSGQEINVVVPATENATNTGPLFTTTETLQVVECAAPGGVVPTQPTACNGDTLQGAGSLFSNADGSLNYDVSTAGFFTVYNTPDNNIGDSSSSPACGDTTETECILYIGTDVTSFTNPHVWSQPFFVSANSGDLGTDPGDGSLAAAASPPSASLSTVVAAPTTVVANGIDTSTVTVTLLSTGSVPVVGTTVSLTGTGQSTIAPATTGSNVTNAEGQATFDVSDATAESDTYRATDTTDSPNVVVTQQAVVDFEAPSVSSANSTVVASPVSSGSATITVTLLDQESDAQPVAGQTVALAGTGSTVSIAPASAGSNVTNASGVATFTATDTAAETVTFTATDTTPTPSVTLAETPSVTFGTAPPASPSPTVSTVVVNGSPAQVGGSGAEVVVTLLTSTDTPVSGSTVSLSSTGSTGNTAVIADESSGSNVTDSSGEATFSVTDTVPETLTLTATDTTASPAIVLAQTPTVTFEAATAGTPSAAESTVALDVGPGLPSSIEDSIVMVTINDASGTPLSGQAVELEITGSATATPVAIGGSTPGTTNSSGQAEFEVTEPTAEAWSATAVDTSVTPNVTVLQTVGISPEPDPAASTSTVVASPTNPAADGTTPTTITVTITDAAGDPISGETVSLKALPAGNAAVITTVNAVSNAEGIATFRATDATAEAVTFQATDVTDGNTPFTSEAQVTFGTTKSTGPTVSPNRSSVDLSRRTCLPNGKCEVLVFVELRDKHGRPVSGKAVTLGFKPSTTVSVTPLAVGSSAPGTTGLAGFVLFEITDTTTQAVTITATDTTDGIVLANKPTVLFAKSRGFVWLPPRAPSHRGRK